MKLKLKVQRDGTLRPRWYGAWVTDGRYHETSLCRWRGKPPASFRVKDEGDKAFEDSRTRALAELRRELLDSLGVARARGLLVRMGFASGKRDGELALGEMRAGMPYEKAFMLGPQLHSIEGAVRVEKVHLELDLKAKHFVGEFLWTNSWECDAHVTELGYGDDPQCWQQIGYASGYTSAFVGRLIVFKETECHSMGDSHCRIVGQAAEDWHDDEYVDYFRPQRIGERLIDYSIGLEHLRAV